MTAHQSVKHTVKKRNVPDVDLVFDTSVLFAVKDELRHASSLDQLTLWEIRLFE